LRTLCRGAAHKSPRRRIPCRRTRAFPPRSSRSAARRRQRPWCPPHEPAIGGEPSNPAGPPEGWFLAPSLSWGESHGEKRTSAARPGIYEYYRQLAEAAEQRCKPQPTQTVWPRAPWNGSRSRRNRTEARRPLLRRYPSQPSVGRDVTTELTV